MRRSRSVVVITIIAAVVSLFPVLSAQAQQAAPRLSLDFSDVPLKDVLQAVCKAGNLAAVQLPEGAGDKRITVSLVDNTPNEALTVVLNRANLVAVNDGGTTVIKEKSTAVAADPGRTTTTRAPASADILRQPPTAVRVDNTTGDVGRGTALTPALGMTAAGTAASQQNANKVYRIISTNFMNVQMLADMLGGSTVSEDDYRNSINGGSNGNSNGNSNNNGYNNNSNGNSNTSNRSSRTNSTNRSSGW